MLGRGTRKGEHFPDKTHFVVFDCFDGTLLEYFKNATAITAEPPRPEPRTIIEIIDDIWANRDRDYNIRRLVKRLQRINRDMAGEETERFAAIFPMATSVSSPAIFLNCCARTLLRPWLFYGTKSFRSFSWIIGASPERFLWLMIR